METILDEYTKQKNREIRNKPPQEVLKNEAS
jgi:hypothetical protein